MGPWSYPVTCTSVIPEEPNRWSFPKTDTSIPHDTVKVWRTLTGWVGIESIQL